MRIVRRAPFAAALLLAMGHATAARAKGLSGAEPAPLAQRESPAPPRVWVHIYPRRGVLLQRAIGSGDWETVCSAPCDELLLTDLNYRVTGNGTKSAELALRGSPGTHETLVVDGASKGWFVLGVAGVAVGAPTVAGGFLVWASGAIEGDGKGAVHRSNGLVTMGVGALALVAGLVLVEPSLPPAVAVGFPILGGRF